MSKKEKKEINPNEYSYREGTKMEIPSEIFETMRSYAIEQVKKNEPKHMMLQHKLVVNKDGEVEPKEFESIEEYKNQQPFLMQTMEAAHAGYVYDLLTGIHVENIEKGEAVDIETLREEYNKKNSKIKKVED